MKLHVEVMLLASEKVGKKTRRPAAWAVLEGKTVRGEGRVLDDSTGLHASSAGRMFAAALYMAHGKIVKTGAIDATVWDGKSPKPSSNGAAPKKAKTPKASKA